MAYAGQIGTAGSFGGRNSMIGALDNGVNGAAGQCSRQSSTHNCYRTNVAVQRWVELGGSKRGMELRFGSDDKLKKRDIL